MFLNANDLQVWSSAVLLNTQYMHSIWFNLTLDREITLEGQGEVRGRYPGRGNP